jgi:hypothetical protein
MEGLDHRVEVERSVGDVRDLHGDEKTLGETPGSPQGHTRHFPVDERNEVLRIAFMERIGLLAREGKAVPLKLVVDRLRMPGVRERVPVRNLKVERSRPGPGRRDVLRAEVEERHVEEVERASARDRGTGIARLSVEARDGKEKHGPEDSREPGTGPARVRDSGAFRTRRRGRHRRRHG